VSAAQAGGEAAASRLIRLEAGGSRALVYPELGFQLFGCELATGDGRRVELVSAPADGREPPDRRYGNPVLFPSVGVSIGSAQGSWDHGGRALPMPMHGWARNSAFEIQALDARSVAGVLRPAPSTGMRLGFPFDLELGLTYRLDGGALTLSTAVSNIGDAPFPYALGFHPYLRAPLGSGGGKGDGTGGARDRCLVSLPAGTRLTTGDGWRTHAGAPVPARIVTASDPELAGSIVLADTGASSLALVDATSGLAAEVSVEGSEQSFPIWVVWTSAPDAPYICLEPWTDAPNALNRPGTRTLPAGTTHRYQLRLSLRPA
jgi:galactose mutarotase-like enzyme